MSSSIKYIDQNSTEIPANEIPFEVPVIPLRNAVIFPGVILPVFVGRSDSMSLIEKEAKPGTLIGLFTQKNAEEETVEEAGLNRTGTLAEVHKITPMSEGGFQVVVQGVQKIELTQIVEKEPYLKARISGLGEVRDHNDEEVLEFQAHVIRYIQKHPGIPDEVINFVKRLDNPAALCSQVAFFADRDTAWKLDILKTSSVAEKMNKLKKFLLDESNKLAMEKEVRDKVEKDASKMQRDFYLRKQLEQIRKELGETDDDDADELAKQLEEKNLPEEIRKAVDKELKRYRRLNEGPQGAGMEAGQIRNWLELIIDLPWEDPELPDIDLKKARQILNEDHEGLEEVKERILEHLAVEKKTQGARAPILCLVGPPGVGKTSLARSIARAMERKMVRAALGGVRDEAEIRGHRRTYVGALPGKILTAMKKAETRGPVFLLDEIDKTGVSYQGDPSAALLEVLDSEQNDHFEDHYLGLPYDLSRSVFVCTANSTETIPAPLLDRMEVVHISGYVEKEKIAIAENHLWPDILQELKIEQGQVDLTEDALKRVVNNHTREAGVRNLKRKLESIARKALLKLYEKNESVENTRLVFDSDQIQELLGKDRFTRDTKEDTGIPGLAIGLAWTPVGGDILYIETIAYPGKGEIKLSGKLGDVMKESAIAAYSYMKAHAEDLGINAADLIKKDIHIHIPSGAIPKDGPSAGVTLLSSLTSLFTGRPVAPGIAMTGEISLRGKILPVGGIKEKVLAAKAAGIETVLLPEKNRPDFEEIPDQVKEGLNVEYFSDMMQLLKRTVPRSPKFPDREGW